MLIVGVIILRRDEDGEAMRRVEDRGGYKISGQKLMTEF